ncbi:MAG TPA: bifunctional nuclease family protein [Dehalococcoidia bacterium]
MIEMSIEAVRVSMQNLSRVLILKEKQGEHYLVIWIGPAEAEAIAMKLGEAAPPRPMTHDLLRNVIDSLGAQVSHIIVNDISNDTFYARIVLDSNGKVMEIDSRVSDAVALAVRAQVPIYADEAVVERAGLLIDREPEGQLSAVNSEPVSRVGPEELEKMSAFQDFINSLDLDDFDKRKQG